MQDILCMELQKKERILNNMGTNMFSMGNHRMIILNSFHGFRSSQSFGILVHWHITLTTEWLYEYIDCTGTWWRRAEKVERRVESALLSLLMNKAESTSLINLLSSPLGNCMWDAAHSHLPIFYIYIIKTIFPAVARNNKL